MISSIHYKDSKESENITRFLVILKSKFSKIYPNQFFKKIRDAVRRDWLLKHNNISTPLKSGFFQYAEFNVEREMDFGNYLNNVSTPLYRMVFQSLHDILTDTYSITKLYLCDLIELTEDEFILSQNKKMLFNKITTKQMFDAEFDLISWKTFDGLRARICINDSGFHRTNKATFSSGGQTFNTYWSVSSLLLLLLGTNNHFIQHS